MGAAEIEKQPDGLFVLDRLPVLMSRLGLFDRSKGPAPNDYVTTSQIEDFHRKLQSTPGFLWMVTDDNERATQVNAGRAFARVQLAAMAFGVSLQPLQQALQEYPEQAATHAGIRRLLDASQAARTVQMWARAGFAPPIGPAPRRGVEAPEVGDRGHYVLLVSDPQMATARVADEPRAWNVLGGVTRTVEGTEQIIGRAHDERRCRDALQLVARE